MSKNHQFLGLTTCLTTYKKSNIFTISRCSAVGSAPVSGTGGREFESRHFDQKKRTAPCEWFSFLSKRCYDSNLSCVVRCEFAYPPVDLKACFQGAGGGYIRPWRKSRHTTASPRLLRLLENIVVAYRLRKPSALPSPYFLRARPHKQLSTVYASLTCHFDQKTAENKLF